MHSFTSAVMAVAVAALATAVPTERVSARNSGGEQCAKEAQLADFDDLNGIPATINNPIPTPYKGLEWQGFQFANTLSTGGLLPGVAPHSTPNYAISNAVVTTLGGTATLTTNYLGGDAGTTFDLRSFYYGCVVQLQNGAAAVPTECTVSIAGFRGSDNTVADSRQVCAQSFTYNPTTSLGLQQSAFTGPITDDCTDLDFVQVNYNLPGGASALEVLLGITIDDVKYDLKTC